MKISYCTTHYNRFESLRNALPENIKAIINQNAEIVVVDFNGNDSDESCSWIKKSFKRELESNKLKYYRRKVKGFVWAASVAKNIAHRFAAGDVLVNLDCDNSINVVDHEKILNSFMSKKNIKVYKGDKSYFLEGNNACQKVIFK